MRRKKKVIRTVVIGILLLILVGIVGMSVITGKQVRDGILYQNENNDTK